MARGHDLHRNGAYLRPLGGGIEFGESGAQTLTQDTFPKIKVNNYLFSKIQRAKMGLPVSDDEKQIEIFRFYQNILSAKNVYLFYVKNVDEKIDSAGVVEEIKLKYDINSIINEISKQKKLNFVKKYF